MLGYGTMPCALARRTGYASAAVALITLSLQNNRIWVGFYSEGVPLPSVPDTIEITLAGSPAVTVHASVDRDSTREHELWIGPLADDLLEKVVRAQGIAVHAGAERYFDIAAPLPAAVAALRACRDTTLLNWGIDVAARRRLGRLPELSPMGLGITSSDYPAPAIRAGAQGTTRIRLLVSADGRVAECAVISSSGNRLLDAQSCALTQARARYQPALDGQGRPVAAEQVETVNWRLHGF